MSFQNLSPLAVGLGIAGLAGLLFALQRLRVRYRAKEVVTTLFWKEAVEDARARVLVDRFRHPLAYGLAVLIASLLWVAFASPAGETAEDRKTVVLLDASGAMTRDGRFAAALEALRDVVDRTPRATTTVIACGASPTTVLLAGESVELLEHRLDGLEPSACPPTIQGEVLRLGRGAAELRLVIVGDSAIEDDVRGLLPEGVRVSQVTPAAAAEEIEAGLIALGVTEARSGAWDRVDVLVRIRGAATPAFVLGGLAFAPTVEETSVAGRGERRLLLRDVPAAGQRLAARLPGDALSADDRAEILLPSRPRLRVRLEGASSEAFRAVLAADPAVLLAEDRPDLVVTDDDSRVPAGTPAIVTVPDGAQDDAIMLHHGPEEDSSEVLLASFDRLGLAEVDAMELARRAGRPISIGARAASERRVTIQGSLLGARFNFVQSRSFPLFVAQSVRWLAGVEEITPVVRAGRATRSRAAFTDASGRSLEPAGAAFVPPSAGVYRGADGTQVTASLSSPEVSGTEVTARTADLGGGSGAWGAVTWLALVALALLAIEWILHRTGRMP